MAVDLERDAAVDLAAAVRAKTVSPTELVDEFIARVEQRNPSLNAVVATRFDAARAEAAAQTTQLMNTDDTSTLPPFFGVPGTIKDCFGLQGLPHTAGSLRRRDTLARVDGTAPARLRAAGIVALGVTNVPEMAFWNETDNLVYGRTNNPYDVTRTVSGSSGGEGAAVGSGMSPIGLGSDVGGSIRMPASFCGVFGHKPTGGLVPGTGHVPSPSTTLSRFTCHGPLARSAKDLLPFLRAIAGPDGHDLGVLPAGTVDLRDIDVVRELPLRDVVVHVIDDCGWVSPSTPVLSTVWSAANVLEKHGARLHHARPPELRRAFDIWAESMQAGNEGERSFAEWLGNGERVSVRAELLRIFAGRRRHTSEALAFALLEKAGKRLPIVSGGLQLREQLRARLRQLLVDDRHVIVMPVFPTTAFRHGHASRYPGAFVYSGLWNVLELPATAVPLGVDGGGLPLGVQVIGRHGADRTTIGVATWLERLHGGRVPPR